MLYFYQKLRFKIKGLFITRLIVVITEIYVLWFGFEIVFTQGNFFLFFYFYSSFLICSAINAVTKKKKLLSRGNLIIILWKKTK